MQGILKQMVGPWMRDPAPRESLKGSKKRIKGQSQRSLKRQIVAHYAKDAASWIEHPGQRSSHKISLVHGKAFQRRESNMKEDLILVWVAVSLSRHFLKGLQKIPKRWYTRPCRTECMTGTLNRVTRVTGVNKMTRVRYLSSYLEWVSHQDFKNIA